MRVLGLGLLVLLGCRGVEESRQVAPSSPEPAKVEAAARVDPPPAPVRAARSFRFDKPGGAPAKKVTESPWSLTASDGTGLRVVEMRARAVVDDPLAFTELRLAFENPEDRVLEGRFRITLPTGATVSRFAMMIDDRWQEGEVVELAAARRAYEDTLHRKQDPALLEQAAGNEFSARVFPIPARGVKRLILSYSQDVAARPYTLPLAGLPKVGELDLEVIVRGAGKPETVRAHQTDRVPDADFVLPTGRPAGRAGLVADDLVVARVAPIPASDPEEIRSLLVLFDTSASRALGLERQADLLGELVAGLRGGEGADARLVVAAFDQEIVETYRGRAGDFGDADLAKLTARGAFGASNLGAALEWAAGVAKAEKLTRVLVLGDGVVTAGPPTDAAAAALAGAGVERLDAIAVGGIRDEPELRRLTAALSHPGAVIDGDLPVPEIAARLVRVARSRVAIRVTGAEWSYPRTVDGVQAGDEVLVYASVPGGGPLELLVDGHPLQIPVAALAPGARPLLARAAAQARIAALLEDKARSDVAPEKAAALRKEITALSIRHRVSSPYTALLVLENEGEYARYGIDRRALAEILTVGKEGLEVLDRGVTPPTAGPDGKQQTPPPPRDPEPAERKADEGEAITAQNEAEAPKGGPPADFSAGIDERDGNAAPPPPRPRPEMLERAQAERNRRAPAQERARRPGVLGGTDPNDPLAGYASVTGSGDLDEDDDEEEQKRVDPYTGTFREVMSLIARKRHADALATARAWLGKSPGDVLALIAIGESLEAAGDAAGAARVYGSLIDLFPDRADLRRFAGQRLERLKLPAALALAVDCFGRAAAQRADHPSSHRLHGFALLRAGKPEQAFAVLATGLKTEYPSGRFAAAHEVLAEDLGLAAAAWIAAEPTRREEIEQKLAAAGGRREDKPSLRFVLVWETDANDVDFHIRDAKGNHAFYRRPELRSGGRLYADVTTGYGPECFTIRGASAGRAYPYRLEAHYYARGPMGYGMGKLEIIDHDGRGGLTFEERPFVIMQDHAYVDLGTVKR